MDRAFQSGAAGTIGTPPASPSVGYPTAGNPATATPATKPGPWWYTMITEEIRQVLIDAGLTPDQTNTTQLSQAIRQLVNSGPIKAPVRAATAGANIANLSTGAPNTLDGVTLAAGDRILVKDQTTASQNGIYVVTTLGTGANGVWTRATDSDGVGEFFAGMLVVSSEGTANADAIWELLTDGAITIGTTALTFARKDSTASSGSIQGSFRNLSGSAPGTSAVVTYTIDEVVTGDGAGNFQTTRAWNNTITMTTLGAGGLDVGAVAASTWYYAYAITQLGGTKALIASLSATGPSFTNAAGYTKWARIGAFRTDGTANKFPFGFKQSGRRTQYVIAAGSNLTALPQMASGAQGSVSTPTYVAVAVGNYVPPTAGVIRLIGMCGAGAFGVASNNSYGAVSAMSTANYPPIGSNAAVAINHPADLILESTNIYYVAASASASVACFGWEDNL